MKETYVAVNKNPLKMCYLIFRSFIDSVYVFKSAAWWKVQFSSYMLFVLLCGVPIYCLWNQCSSQMFVVCIPQVLFGYLVSLFSIASFWHNPDVNLQHKFK